MHIVDNMTRRLLLSLAAVVISVVLALPAPASTTGSIRGRVVDSTTNAAARRLLTRCAADCQSASLWGQPIMAAAGFQPALRGV